MRRGTSPRAIGARANMVVRDVNRMGLMRTWQPRTRWPDIVALGVLWWGGKYGGWLSYLLEATSRDFMSDKS